MKQIKLKNCPFCGGNAHVCEQAMEDENQFYIECERCGVECCHATTRDTAALRWNCRHSDAHTSQDMATPKFKLNPLQVRWIMDYIRNAYEAAWKDVRESRPYRGLEIERETGKNLIDILERSADK